MEAEIRILVIEDDDEIAGRIAAGLTQAGFTVERADNGVDGYAMGADDDFDAAILDLGLPEMEGLDVLRRWRQEGRMLPVLVLSARGTWSEKVDGLNAGADDYVAKPCELRELMARIRSVLRRSAPKPEGAPDGAAARPADQLVRFGTKWLDLEAQALRDDEGNEHPLTASEFGLLKVFAANPKRVLSRERLLELANARDSEAFDRAIDLRIMRIRRKIEPDPAKPAVIRTIRGGGYLFSPSGDKA